MSIVTLQFIKDYYGITDETLDTRISFFIPVVEKAYLAIRNTPFDKDESNNTVYPDNADEVAAQMVMFKIKNAAGVSISNGVVLAEKSVKSEGWGDHSISYQDGDALNQNGELVSGYPASIVIQIKRYVGFKAV